jgi:hypothetical protein
MTLTKKIAFPLFAAMIASTACAADQSAPIPDGAPPNPDSSAELAKKLSNPIANLISVPFKYSWDTDIGPAEAQRSTYVVQPVIPFTLSADWNLITRTIMPVYIDSRSPIPGGNNISGRGDILQSFFFSPKAPTASGWIWGLGPVFSYPTANNDLLGSGKTSGGPTIVLLKQASGWTYGLLANQLWSLSGSSDREHVNSTFLQPFLSFTTKTYTTLGVNTQSTYDWVAGQWTAPVYANASQLVKIGKLPVSFQLSYHNYVQRPLFTPVWGIDFQVTLLFPKK